jgi:mRNA-degrading endonuclease toxin of MazEF toxin-antitoxin module
MSTGWHWTRLLDQKSRKPDQPSLSRIILATRLALVWWVLPLTSNVDSLYPGEATLVVDGKPARALGDQIRSLDKSRLRSKIDTLSQEELAAIDEAIRITLALWP